MAEDRYTTNVDQKTVLFLGTPAFAIPSLRAVHACPALRITHVVTQPDRPTGRKQILTPPPVKEVANELGLTVLQPERVNRELPDMLSEQPDFLVTVAYGELIGKTLLELPRISPVNVHPSLLPRWRGASPLQYTILAGDSDGGTTVQVMSPELDAGDVLGQQRITLDTRETAETLHDKLAALSAELLVHVLTNTLQPVPQDPAGITVCGKLSREDGKADPATMTAEHIDRMVRALVPWPGVTCTVDGNEIKLHETFLEEQKDTLPLQCAEQTTLYIGKLQSPGGKVISGKEWHRGTRNAAHN